MQSIRVRVILMSLAALLAGCGAEPEAPAPAAELVFHGANIITMDANDAQAVAVAGDRIIAAGAREEIEGFIGPRTRVVDLGERALLPGFIDAHGHFSAVARNLDLLDLSSPPVGEVTNIGDVVRRIGEFIENEQIAAGELVQGFGYDDSLLAEQRHPDRGDLDRASVDHPIVLRHVSGHLLAVNSMALAQAGVNSATADPPGGVIRRRAGGNEPNGVMEETAMGLFSSRQLSPERYRELRRVAMDIYAAYGITTAQDSNLSPAYVQSLREEAAANPFPVDLVSFISANNLSDGELAQVGYDAQYSNGFRNGGVKFILDGSPQGRTAWLSQPYAEGPEGAAEDYVAYPSYDPEAWRGRIGGLLERGVPVLAHANGDAAIELMIDGVAEALAGMPMPDHRSVIVHAQLIRADQLDRLPALGIIPSYYAVHPFFWGDWHRRSFGEERAAFISPLRATLDRGIPFTVHNDSPVVPPDMMRLLSIAVNRETRGGFVLGPEQRLSVEEALHAVTLGAARQYFEEDEKGSITPGKRADLVILGANPLTADPASLADIEVLETFARGRSIFRREAN